MVNIFIMNLEPTSEYFSSVKRNILYYFIMIIVLISLSSILYLFMEDHSFFGFIGFWLTLFELIIGIGATSSMDILQTTHSVYAHGASGVDSNILRKRHLREKKKIFRKTWLILFVINSVLVIIVINMLPIPTI